MINSVVLVGRLVRDPELKHTPNGVPVATFTVAVDRPFKSSSGEMEADFIDGVVWRQQAEYLASYGEKGRMVGIEGRIQVRRWTGQDGAKHKTTEVLAERVKFLSLSRQQMEERGLAAAVRHEEEEFDPFADIENAPGLDDTDPYAGAD
ncbi:MAG: single-stranded DNA-binding protein [Armatimonadetes bacterium]|nr:single-stranded DNA-binding protein [Armatimonadota bacterium]